jgi:hypothetical protein
MPQWYIDQCVTLLGIAGWMDDNGPAKPIEITINGEMVAAITPTEYRADLETTGFGDGRRAFSFELAGYLRQPTNIILVSYAGEILYSAEIAVPEMLPDEDRLAVEARVRWRRDEPAHGLTWGAYMTGDSLWDRYRFHRDFTSRDHILEIGPGYGRLLRTAIERGIWHAFIGIDLSEVRIGKLVKQFGSDTVRFVEADINHWQSDTLFDAIISSGTFEHL